ncbi:hypothetical protein CVU82_02570 [Candidatus Falkowbacteria bacterium HGW-Falkowbacteria-1]|jgi:hypothetical protein|uniref:Uncharacterized protein n=1 Tax=Candidatus Falkowbacteria bacterium HGW-Falkowbacteria-1 TaxID=2013768 RepID=A0A2N2E9U8_9BACT|nr:MAG: hypothetical protein CVU82_02570 [Candidatus Falkowbacteria bacterium HGW-Falkowbacteria-1]
MSAAENQKKMFSVEEINQLNKETDPKRLEEFFYGIFLRGGDSQEEARKMAKKWSNEMTKNNLPK